MARARELTWVMGANGRKGRWRKKYRGKCYYFDGGRGKSDDAAYKSALTEWQVTKGRIEAEAPSPHYPAYQAAIREWEDVLTCARDYGDEAMATRAVAKLQRLRKDLQLRLRRPPQREDLFQNQFSLEVSNPKLLQAYLDCAKTAGQYAFLKPDEYAGRQFPVAEDDAETKGEWIIPKPDCLPGVDPLKLEAAVWQDRLEAMRRQAAAEEVTARAQLAAYLGEQDSKVRSGRLVPGRRHLMEVQLRDFTDWLGESTGVTEINGQKLLEYKKRLLVDVSSGKWSLTTASSRLAIVKAFIRWLWRTEALPALPRIMDAGCNDLEICKPRAKIVVFTNEEISALLTAATPRTRLYILLTLNTSMTQKDIAELTFEEVDWNLGRVTRRRSKTGRFDSVPVVSYKLWPETFALLLSQKSRARKGFVLTNRNGSPLWVERISPSGKYSKIDNIRCVFNTLRNSQSIDKPFKSLKKTSSTYLASSKHYSSVRSLFLGHAPRSIADRHYAAPPVDLLDEALDWLRTQLEIEHSLESICSELKRKNPP